MNLNKTVLILVISSILGCDGKSLSDLSNLNGSAIGLALSTTSGDGQSAIPGAKFSLPLVVVATNAGVPLTSEVIQWVVTSGDVAVKDQQTFTGATGETSNIATAGIALGEATIEARNVSKNLVASFKLSVTGAQSTSGNGIVFSAVSGNYQDATIGQLFASALKIKLTNKGLGVASETVTFQKIGSASGQLSANGVVTDSNGEASVTYVADLTPGKIEIEATWAKGDKTVNFSLTVQAPAATAGSSTASVPTPVATATSTQSSVGTDIGTKTNTATSTATNTSTGTATNTGTQVTTINGCQSGVALDTASISVTVDFPAGATAVNVYRNGIQIGASTDASAPNVIDSGLVEGVSYNYVCKAVKNGVEVVGTNVLRITTILQDPPIFTGIQTAVVVNANSITARWRSASASGAPASVFKVYLSLGTGGVDFTSAPVGVVNVGTNSYTVANIGEGLPYSVAVRACNTNGTCDTNTAFQTVTTPAGSGPSTVGATAAAIVNGNAVVTAPWTYPNGGLATRSIYMKTGAGTTNVAAYALVRTEAVTNIITPQTSFVVSGLVQGNTYSFIVVDANQVGATSSPTSFATLTATKLSPPVFAGISGLNLGSPADSVITATYTSLNNESISPSLGASNYLGWVTYASYGNTPSNPCSLSSAPSFIIDGSTFTAGQNRSFNISGLSEKTVYAVCIKAQDSIGNTSTNSGYLTVTTKDITSPQFGGLYNFTWDAQNRGYNAAWGASSSADITTYKITLWKNSVTPDGSASTFSVAAASNPSSYFIPLASYVSTNNDVVYASMEACDNASSFSSSQNNCTNLGTSRYISITIPEITPPSFAGITGAQSLTEGETTLSWTNPGTNNIAGYQVYFVNPDNSITLATSFLCTSVGNCPTSTVVGSLTPYKGYTFTVRAFDSNGNVTQLDPAVSQASVAHVVDSTPPSWTAGSGLSSSTVFGSGVSFSMTWGTATDNQDSATGVLSYSLYKRSSAFPTPSSPSVGDLIYTGTTAAYSDSVLSDFTTYYYLTCASDSSSNSYCDPSAISVTAPKVTPPVASTVTGLPANSSTSRVTNLSATVSGSSVSYYKYKVFSGASDSCSTSTGYSAEAAVATTLSSNITSLPDGSVTVCVWGANVSRVYMPVANSTEVTWTKKTVAPPTPTFVSGYPVEAGLSTTLSVNSTGATQYIITRTTVAGATWAPTPGVNYLSTGITSDGVTSIVSATSSFISSGLTDGQTYIFKSFAADALGNWSTPLSYSYSAVNSTPPNFAGVTGVTSDIEGQATLTWTLPSDLTNFAGFKIYAGVNGGAQVLIQSFLCADVSGGVCPTSRTITGLTPYASYKFTVQAFNSRNNLTTLDPSVSFVTLANVMDSTPPTWASGANLASTFVGGTSNLALTWSAALDNQDSTQGSLVYYLYRRTTAFPSITLPSAGDLVNLGTLTSFTDVNNQNQTYYYLVCVRDSSVNGVCGSSSYSITTPDVTPPSSLVLTGAPTGTNRAGALNVTVSSGSGAAVAAVYYKAKVYSAGSGDSCGAASGYGTEVSIATPISTSLTSLPDGTLTLCVIGANAARTYMALANAVTATWTKIRTPPATPAFVTGYPVEGNMKTTIDVSSSGATAYLIARATSNTAVWNPTQGQAYTSTGTAGDGVTTIVATSSTVVDSGLTYGTTYFYFAFASDSLGNWSGPLSYSYLATDPIPPVFGGITGVTSSITEGQATVSWTNPADVSEYAGYNIYTIGALNALTLVGNVTCSGGVCPTSTTVSGLTPYASYDFHVRTYNAYGTTTQLNPATSKASLTHVMDSSPPYWTGTDGLDSMVVSGTAHLDLTWRSVVDNQVNTAAVTYNLYRRVSAYPSLTSPSNSDVIYSGTSASFRDTSTLEATQYFYLICSQDASGNKACASAPYVVTTQQVVAPTSVTLTGVPTGTNRTGTLNISVSGTNVTQYKYKLFEGTSDTCSSSSNYGSSSTVASSITDSIASLADGTITLCVVGGNGMGSYMPFSSAGTESWVKQRTPPGAPTFTSGYPVEANLQTTLDFSSSGAAGYLITRSTTNGTVWVPTGGQSYSSGPAGDGVTTILSTSSTYVNSGLTLGQIYYYNIYARDNLFNWSTSLSYNHTAAASIPPSFGGVTGVTSLAEGQATVSWINPADTSVYASYKIYTIGSGNSLSLVATATCVASCPTSATVSGLTPYAGYTFHVKVVDIYGNLSTNNPTTSKVTLTNVMDSSPPYWTGSDGTMTTPNMSTGAMTVSWNATTDNQHSSGIVTYILYKRTTSFPSVSSPSAGDEVYRGTSNSFLDTALTQGQLYYYLVCAKDSSDNVGCASSAYSATAPVYTPPTAVYISGAPSGTSRTNPLNVTVSGPGTGQAVTYYKYKIFSGVSDSCASSSNYGSEQAVATPITANISALADGSVTLCVIGASSGRVYTSTASAASATWIKKVTPPATPTWVSSYPATTDLTANLYATTVDASFWLITRATSNGNVWAPTGGQTNYTTGAAGDGITTIISVSQSIVNSSLVQGTTYYYYVYAGDSVGNWSSPLTVTYQAMWTTPPTFGGLTSAVSTVQGEAALGWTNASNTANPVVGYKIYTVSGATATLFTSFTCASQSGGVCPTSYTLSGLTPNQTYNFYVSVYDQYGNITAVPLSTAISVTIIDTTPPAWGGGSSGIVAAPAAQGSLSVNLSWSSAVDASGTNITYTLYRNTSTLSLTSPPAINAVYQGTATSFTDTSTAETSTFYYLICATDATVNRQCDSANLSYTSPKVTPPTATATGAPSGTNRTSVVNITVGGTGVVKYMYKILDSNSVDSCTTSADWSSQIVVATNITDNIVSKADGVIRLCLVGANQGYGSWLNWQTYANATTATWTKQLTSPAAPTITAGYPIDYNLKAVWAFSGTGSCVNYLVTRTTVAGTVWTPSGGQSYSAGAASDGVTAIAYSGVGTSFTDSGLTAGTKYVYFWCADNLYNWSTETAVTYVASAMVWTKVVPSTKGSVGLTNHGLLYSWSASANTCLGHGVCNGSAVTVPTPLSTPASGAVFFTDIVVDLDTTTNTNGGCALSSGGYIYCWGGAGSQTTTWNPTTKPTLTKIDTSGTGTPTTWSSIAGNAGVICAIGSVDSDLWCWGLGTSGAVGDGLTTVHSQIKPLKVAALSGVAIKQVSISGQISTNTVACAVTTANNAYCWGAGLYAVGSNTGTPTLVPYMSANFSKVWPGYHVTCGVATTDSKVYCWGYDSTTYCHLGDNPSCTNTTKLVGPYANTYSSMASSSNSVTYSTVSAIYNGALYGWGANTNYVVGDNTNTHRQTPTAAATTNTAGLTFSSLYTGGNQTHCAITNLGRAFCWGTNNWYQTGIFSTLSTQQIPIEVDTTGATGW